ncbi:MAG: hypothetical protein NTY10_06565 [Candidatus Omnitrophica bacterium]|nr:hypothetical protein [Candidatus Omnitrophota bacterium]
MKQNKKVAAVIVFAALLSVIGLIVRALIYINCRPEQPVRINAPARIFPDYDNTVIPPNIAPLNFVIKEPGQRFYVRVLDQEGGLRGQAFSRDGRIRIPPKTWRRLLQNARGKSISLEPFARDAAGHWRQFSPLCLRVAPEPIDEYLIYRLIYPVYNSWSKMGIYQRRISTFKQTEILSNTQVGRSCINCHTFSANQGDRMLLQVRHPSFGPSMIIAAGGNLKKTDLRTKLYPKTPTYTAWHPNGDIVAFSQNKIQQFFHSGGRKDPRDVVDQESDLAIYNIRDGNLTYSPKISRSDRLETWPEWSPDGKYLYFSSAKTPWEKTPKNILGAFKYWPIIKYDLMRIEFDAATNNFRQVETLLDSRKTGMSMSQPRVSPDGRRLIFVGHDYGSFPIFQESANLWMLDLQTKKARPISEINSDRTDSWHSWSSNGRWIVFSSKRDTGRLSRPYFTYIDTKGQASKPVLLPQKDPAFYDYFPENFNRPELSAYPVPVNQKALAQVINRPDKEKGKEPVTGAAPRSDEPPSSP